MALTLGACSSSNDPDIPEPIPTPTPEPELNQNNDEGTDLGAKYRCKEITNTAYFEIEATSESSKHKVKDVTAEYNK